MKNTYYRFNDNELQFIKTNKPYKIWFITMEIAIALLTIAVGICIHKSNKVSQLKSELSEVNAECAMLTDEINVITNDCNYENVVKAKAGEYAMHPHKLKNSINQQAVADVLMDVNAWYPDIKMAQIQMESSFGKSNIANEANNVCSMRVTHNRETTQLKSNSYKGFGVYNNWESCVVDMVLWDYAVFKRKMPTRQEYLAMLQSIYSESPTYAKTVSEQSKKYQKYFN